MSKLNLDFLNNPGANPVPEEVRELVAGLIEGTISGFVLVAQTVNGATMDAIFMDLNDSDTNVLALLGGLEVLKRDFMRATTESRVEYVEVDLQDGDDDDDGN